MKAIVPCLLAMLDQAFDRRSWHGTNLRGSLRGLSTDTALWRPAPERHNIWELTLHTAYWKYAVRRRLTDEKRGGFPLAGSNFWERTKSDPQEAWKRDLKLLVHQHQALRAAVAKFPAARLLARVPKSRYTYSELIQGAAAHDLYHAGQIQLLKRLARAGGVR